MVSIMLKIFNFDGDFGFFDHALYSLSTNILDLLARKTFLKFFTCSMHLSYSFQGDRLLSTRIFHRFQVLARRCRVISNCKFLCIRSLLKSRANAR